MEGDEMHAILRQRFTSLCTSLGTSTVFIAKWWDVIQSNYSAPSRRYHTLEHLNEMYTHFDTWKRKLQRPQLVELAIFFHDVIYEGTAKEDELKSADVYRNFAEEAGQPEADLELVYRWIVATATHAVAEEDTYDGYFFMDFDMAILGVDQTQYKAYARSVKEEYMNLKGYQKIPFVWEVMWCWGRPKAMSNFLKVSNIYSTKEFQTNLESRARENLQEEVGKLLYRRNQFLAVCTVFGVIVTGAALKGAEAFWF